MATAADMDRSPVDSQPDDDKLGSSTHSTDENTCDGSKESFLPPVLSAQIKQTHESIPKRELHKAEDEPDVSDEAFTEQLPVSELESNLQAATTGEAVGNLTEDEYQGSRQEQPNKDTAESGNSRDSTGEGEGAVSCTASSLLTDSSQHIDKIKTSKQVTREGLRSSRDPLVTGLTERSSQGYAAVSHAPVNCEPDLKSDQGSGSPTESTYHDDTETRGLLEDLKEKNKSLEMKVSILEEVLEKKDTVHVDLQTQCNSLQQQLEETKGQYAELQRANEELKTCLNESKQLEAEHHQQKTEQQEMYAVKEQECIKLVEYIRQQENRYANSQIQVGSLEEENLELSERLNSVIQENEQLQSDIQKLQVLHNEELRLKSEKSHNAEMEKEKVMKELTVRTEQLENCASQFTLLQQDLEEFTDHINVQLHDYKKEIEEFQSLLEEKTDMLAESHDMLRKAIQELSEKSAELENCEAQYIRSQQELEEKEKEIEEFQSRLKENTDMLDENNELLRKALQMWRWKQEECDNLEARYEEEYENFEAENASLHRNITFIALNCKLVEQKCKKKDVVISQQDQKYHNTLREMEELKRECQKFSKKLDKAELLLKLQKERERRKLDLQRKIAYVSQAPHNAGTNRMKLVEKIRKMRQLARARNSRIKIELTSAIDKRKGTRMANRDKKSHVDKWPSEEEEEGGGGGEELEGGEVGGKYGSQEEQNEGEANSIWLRKEQKGGEKEKLERLGQEVHNDGPLNSTASSEEKAE